MKVFKPIGSKERLVEVFERVNKVKLIEGIYETGNLALNAENTLDIAFNQLKNNNLNIKHSSTSSNGTENYIELICTDKQGNNITFTFKVESSEGDQEGVYGIENAILFNFTFDSVDNEDVIELADDALKKFNAQHSDELYDVIENYVDIESPKPEYSEDLEEAIKLIDSIKTDSSPYGGGFDKMQTGKAYADEKPTNSAVRVKAPELDKFIQEDIAEDIPKIKEDIINKAKEVAKLVLQTKGFDIKSVPSSEYNLLIKRIANVMYEQFLANNRLNEEEGDYPNPIGKKFKVKSNYPKKKKKVQTTIKIDESTDQDRYEEVVFLQGDEAFEPLEILDNKGKDAALRYLKQWHYPGEHMGTDELGHGSSDYTYEKDGYIMSWNPSLGYIGLVYDLSNLNEDEKPIDDEPKKSIDPPVSKMNGGFEKEEPENDDELSSELDVDNIEQLAQDKEEAGEMISGGLGDGKSPLEFEPEQIKLGMKVEMEHTDDPIVALEIALDHLSEDPEYYTTKDDPEASAQANASAEAAEGDKNLSTNPNMGMGSPAEFAKKMNVSGDDKEMTDLLLGYKPINVGDEIDEMAHGWSDALLNQEPFLGVKNALINLFKQDKKFSYMDVTDRAANKVKNYHDYVTKALQRYDANTIANHLYKDELKNQSQNQTNVSGGMQQSAGQEKGSQPLNTKMNEPVFKEVVSGLRNELTQMGLGSQEIEKEISDIFNKHLTQISKMLLHRTPIKNIINSLLSGRK